MTDPTHGQNTGGDAPGSPEPNGPSAFSVPGKPRFAAESSPPADAHSPASPYTVTSTTRAARALPMDDDDDMVVPVAPDAAVLPVAPAAAVLPVAPAPVVAPVVARDPSPAVEPAETAPPIPVTAHPDPFPTAEPDDYIEPPLVPRPYAVPTPAFAPGPPLYSPVSQAVTPPVLDFEAPTQPFVTPTQPRSSASPSHTPAVPPATAQFQSYPTPVPPPSYRQGETPKPYAPPSDDDAPPLAARLYAQPGSGTYSPTPQPPTHGELPAYGSSLEQFPPFGGPAVPAMATGFGAAKPRAERVGRGLLFALVAVVGGCILSAVIYHLGFVASIVALAMGGAGIFLYAKGAGSPPRKGAVALVVLLMAGILLAWVSSVGTELYFYYVSQKGTSDGALLFAIRGALSLDLFKQLLREFLIFVGFGALGVFGVARQLLLPRKVK